MSEGTRVRADAIHDRTQEKARKGPRGEKTRDLLFSSSSQWTKVSLLLFTSLARFSFILIGFTILYTILIGFTAPFYSPTCFPFFLPSLCSVRGFLPRRFRCAPLLDSECLLDLPNHSPTRRDDCCSIYKAEKHGWVDGGNARCMPGEEGGKTHERILTSVRASNGRGGGGGQRMEPRRGSKEPERTLTDTREGAIGG